MRNSGRMLPAVLRSLFSKTATVDYPNNKDTNSKAAHFRGRLSFDPTKCIGCKLCSRDCPSNAIEIVKVGDKQFRAIVQLDRCIYCAQCCDSCNKNALTYTREFELANFKREDLKVDIGNDRT